MGRLPPLLWLKTRGWMLCWKDRLDVFWGTNAFLPTLPKRVRKVITVHDLCFQITPETYSIGHLWMNRLFFLKDVARADFVIANSRATAGRFREILGYLPPVIYPAVGDCFTPRTGEEITQCLRTYGICQPYIFHAAAWEPRKNIERLIQAFLMLKDDGSFSHYTLVLAGSTAWKCRRIQALTARNRHNGVVSLGYVPDKHLPSLYSGADVFVFPSIYEGFGMPVLEARACGTRVVATDTPELREAGGKDAVYIQPTREGICDGILKALRKGKPASAPLDLPSWEKGAMTLANALQGGGRPRE